MPNSDHSAHAGLHAIPSRPFRSSPRISVLFPFLNFFSRTGAEKLFGFSEPAPQIPDRELRRLWLWFDPSALGVNVDRTLNVGHLLSGQYDEFTARPRGERPRVCFLSLRPVSSWHALLPHSRSQRLECRTGRHSDRHRPGAKAPGCAPMPDYSMGPPGSGRAQSGVGG